MLYYVCQKKYLKFLGSNFSVNCKKSSTKGQICCVYVSLDSDIEILRTVGGGVNPYERPKHNHRYAFYGRQLRAVVSDWRNLGKIPPVNPIIRAKRCHNRHQSLSVSPSDADRIKSDRTWRVHAQKVVNPRHFSYGFKQITLAAICFNFIRVIIFIKC